MVLDFKEKHHITSVLVKLCHVNFVRLVFLLILQQAQRHNH